MYTSDPHLEKIVEEQFPEYAGIDDKLVLTLNTDLSKKVRYALSRRSSKIVFYIPETLKVSYYQTIHENIPLGVDTDRVSLICGSLSPVVVEEYQSWCYENSYTPLKVHLMEMFSNPYLSTDFDPFNVEHILNPDRDKHYLCMNRSVRPHRIECVAWLYEQDLFNKGLISHPDNPVITPDHSPLSKTAINWLEKQSRHLPYVLDSTRHYHGGEIQHSLLMFARRVHFQIVTETSFYNDPPGPDQPYNDLFITEKTYKPFFMGHPFVVLGHPGTIKRVRDKGFDVFDDIIDHKYDLEYNHDIRFKLAMMEIRRLCDIELTVWEHNRRSIMDRLLENHVKYTKDLAKMPKKI